MTKFAAALALLCYMVGLLVVNFYLLTLNVSDFELLKPRYITTGALALSVVALATIAPVFAAWLVNDVIRFGRWRKHPFIATDGILIALTALVAPRLFFAKWLSQGDLIGLVSYWFIAVFGLLLLLATKLIRSPSSEDVFVEVFGGKKRGRSKRRVSPAWSRTPQPKWVASVLLLFFLLPYSGLTLLLLAREVFPRIPEQFGGGQPREVTLAISSEAEPSLRDLGVGFQGSTSQTRTVFLLFEGNDYYVVSSGEPTSSISTASVDDPTYRIPKAAVLGILVNL